MSHVHNSLEHVKEIVAGLKLPEIVKEDILNVYQIIADAESRAHGVPVEEVHFHEVGTKDAIADIAAACLIIRHLNPDKIVASPVCTGYGTVDTAHGELPVPAPATAYILEGIPTYQGDVESELCTPTGAALLKYFADEFGEQPLMRVTDIGYGFGKKDFKKLNAVRAVLGETEDQSEDIVKIECTIDDMTGEEIGFAVEELIKSHAVDVYTSPVFMKKNRPGTLLTVIVDRSYLEETVREIFRLTTTLGMRVFDAERYTLDRGEELLETGEGELRVKVSSGYGTETEKVEYEDLAAIAREKGLSLREALEIVLE